MTEGRYGSTMFYDTVIFDAAGTLIGRESPDFFEEFFVVAAGELGTAITLDQAKAALAKAMEEPRFRLREGRMSTPDQTRQYFLDLYARVLNAAGVEGDLLPGLRKYYDRFQDGRYLDVYSDVRTTLESLKGHGVRLGVLSNWSEHLSLVLERFDLDRYFSFLVVSAEVGCEKPDEKIFRMAIRPRKPRSIVSCMSGTIPMRTSCPRKESAWTPSSLTGTTSSDAIVFPRSSN